jgi:hypothetical protein
VTLFSAGTRAAPCDIKLQSADSTSAEIGFKDGQQLINCGVVTAANKRFVK